MRTELLAEELADFWLPVMASQSWEQRNQTLNEIHDQLYQDIAHSNTYRAISPWLLAGIIHRLGEPAVDQLAQAQIYQGSLDQRHREAARRWHEEQRPIAVAAAESSSSRHAERRRAPRYRINQPSRLRTDDAQIEFECQMRDVSRDGAGILVSHRLAERSEIQITLPSGQWRQAQVVYGNAQEYGLRLQAAA